MQCSPRRDLLLASTYGLTSKLLAGKSARSSIALAPRDSRRTEPATPSRTERPDSEPTTDAAEKSGADVSLRLVDLEVGRGYDVATYSG
jgi:hypothetical protein